MEQESLIDRGLAGIRRVFGVFSTNEVVKLMNLESLNRKFGIRRSAVSDKEFYNMVDRILEHPNNYHLFKLYSRYHPALRQVHERIVLEMFKNGVGIRAKFSVKCTDCGMEFKRPVDKCTECECEELRTPDRNEKLIADAWMRDPNLDDEITDQLESLAFDMLAMSNAYYFKRKLKHEGIPTRQIVTFVEDAEYIHIATDGANRLGNYRYFCPDCFDGRSLPIDLAEIKNTYENHEEIYTHEQYKRGVKCDLCGGDLYEIAYVQKKNGKIQALWHRDEMIHFNSNPRLPLLQGQSLIASILMELRSTLSLSKNNLALYELGRLAKIIVLKGESQQDANDLADSIITQLEKVQKDEREGKLVNKLRSMFIGGKKGVEVHDAMPSSRDNQSLEWQRHWFIEVIASSFGVQPIYINQSGQGGGGGGYYQRMQIKVNTPTTEKYQTVLTTNVNQQLFPDMMVYDWELFFPPVEDRNEREDAQTWSQKLAAGQQAVQMGLTAEITDEGELKIGGGAIIKVEDPVDPTKEPKNLPPDPEKPLDEGEERENSDE